MAFSGWPSEALEFYEGLEADNSKTYWMAHKAVYDEQVRAPMEALLADLEAEFGPGRIFRPYRDVRFSADKSPYKTAIAATLTRGGYIHLSAAGLAAGSGMYHMERDQLARYRAAVDDDRIGPPLERIVAEAAADGVGIHGHDRLKRVPRGYPPDHPRADLLRHKGVVAWKEWPIAPWLGTAAAKRRVADFLRASVPLNQWLATHVGPSMPAAE
ncbi:uncharacterized protein (TIGR02453 family) [Asanoa ferruginea]|uniref:Uncharacterized protein (TIGR02453 family) n=1 Tax=Asanoa ferruginea TaxID=53367 RepID=A0A3D9ZL50_9ACTN|nr:DUF2461 domain-containing protein [Asanoa ferruginea]REF97314.1 uncharacterized protein (TIGR02453 family) [Asanoa ferruginea]GIF49036.1 TIGR02453 family protein [Asanoa ferruginea]